MQEMQETEVQSLGQEDPLEKEMETHSSILAWKTPWTEEPGRLQSMGSQRVRYNSVTKQQQHLINVMILSGGHRRVSGIHIHVSVLLQTSFPSRLAHNIEQSSLCYTVGLC